MASANPVPHPVDGEGGEMNDDDDNNDGSNWKTVGSKRRPRKKIPTPAEKEERKQKWMTTLSPEEKERIARGECILCGKYGHRRSVCPDKKPDKNKKRAHEPGSGVTPESKKANNNTSNNHPADSTKKKEEKYAYAVVDCKHGLVLERKDFQDMTTEEEEAFTTEYNDTICQMVMDGKDWFPQADRWSLRQGRLVIDIPDKRSEDWFKAELGKKDEYAILTKEESEARKMTLYTGYLRGPTTKLPKVKLNALLKVGLKQAKVTGKVELIKIADSPAGGIMVLLASEEAKDEMANAGFTLRIGAAGLVRFTEGHQKGQTRRLETKIETARQRRDELNREVGMLDHTLTELVKEKEKAADEATDKLLNDMKLILPKEGETSSNDNNMEINVTSVIAPGNEMLAKQASSSTVPK